MQDVLLFFCEAHKAHQFLCTRLYINRVEEGENKLKKVPIMDQVSQKNTHTLSLFVAKSYICVRLFFNPFA